MATMTMKEIIVHPLPELHTTIHEVNVPTPGPDEIIVRVVVAGSNVKDWDHITNLNIEINSGDDGAGFVHALGTNVEKSGEFKIGDRVAGMHTMLSPGGTYAEFAVLQGGTTTRIPKGLGFEEAATLPLILTTSAISLFRRQSLPPPWSPRTPSAPPLPLIIYGASSALGAFTIKLARASNIHPILAIAGSSTSHITPLLDAEKGDTLFDYNVGAEKMIQEVNGRLRELGLEAKHAVDCISSRAAKTWIPITQMLAPGGVLSVVSGANRYDDAGIKEGVKIIYTYVGTAHSGAYRPGMPKQGDEEEVRGDPEWVWLFWRYASRMLADGRLTGHPYKVVEGGLEGVEKGLNMLKRGEARGVKFVYRLTEEE